VSTLRDQCDLDEMAEYNSLKVPDLKKLLTDRGLAVTGNKPDLIKRLQDEDEAKGGEEGGSAGMSSYRVQSGLRRTKQLRSRFWLGT
jgi:hypothetical protein